MGERHKHADVIIAWAEGAELEVKQHFANGHEGQWEPFRGEDAPFFNSWRYEYRVKPKTVKREGWINVYGEGIVGKIIHHSKEQAISMASCPIKATVHIEWEEEE